MVHSPSAEIQSLSQQASLPLESTEFAQFLDDQVDELKSKNLRSEFLFPSKKSIRETATKSKEFSSAEAAPVIKALAAESLSDENAVYMIGNSLGLQPVHTRRMLNEELDVWAQKGVNGHFDHPHDRPWVTIDDTVIAQSAKIVGAKPEEVAIMNSLTTNLHLMMIRFYRPTATRYKILIESKSFPSDYFAVSSQAELHGFDAASAIIEVEPREGSFNLQTEDILAAIEKEGDSIALVLFSGVQYYTGQFFDLKTITEAGHKIGAVVGLDLAHAAGNVPLALHNWNVDFACWCSYKYLNAGPGGIGGTFVHERHANSAGPRLSGWWGTEPSTKFAMAHDFKPIAGANGFRLSNPSVVSTVSLYASLQVFAKTSMDELRRKSLMLTAYLELLLNNMSEHRGFQIITPRDPNSRGCQLSLLFEDGLMEPVFLGMSLCGVLADERRPNVIRVSPAPLYCTFQDVHAVCDSLRRVLRLMGKNV